MKLSLYWGLSQTILNENLIEIGRDMQDVESEKLQRKGFQRFHEPLEQSLKKYLENSNKFCRNNPDFMLQSSEINEPSSLLLF